MNSLLSFLSIQRLPLDGCPYIEFGTITPWQGKVRIVGDCMITATAPVWRRLSTSSRLGMTESQLVEWGMLIGIDYTKPFYMKAGEKFGMARTEGIM